VGRTGGVLRVGFWTGSGSSIAMDRIAATLSGGNTTQAVGTLGGDEFALSKIFIALDVTKASPGYAAQIDATLADLRASERIDENAPILYPGEKEYQTRLDNLANGVPVNDEVWKNILSLR